jgi:hypothetical protein
MFVVVLCKSMQINASNGVDCNEESICIVATKLSFDILHCRTRTDSDGQIDSSQYEV